MLNRLIEFALKQRLFISVMTMVLIGGGLYAALNLPIDAFPDVSSTQVKIIMKAPGMTPEEVEARITTPIELEMLGIPNQKILRSVSKYALADITIDFNDGTDIYWARQQVTERLNGILKDLPAEASGGLAPITTPLGEMFMFTIEGNLSLLEKRSLLDWTIRPALRTIPGVADVNALGGLVKTFEVVPNLDALAIRGMTLTAVKAALEKNNRNDGAGRLVDGEEVLLVRSPGSVLTINDIQSIVIAQKEGNPIRIQDVAEVRIGNLTRYGTVIQSNRKTKGEIVEGLVLGLRGANAQQVVEGVKAKLEELKPSLPNGVKINIFYDRSDLVQRAVKTVSSALFEATVLVVILLVVFLGNARAALVVALTLPLAALFTFILMRYFDLSANLMSLGGLAIAIGMLVDAAVVVVENIMTYLGDKTHKHLSYLNIIFRAVSEVSIPVGSGVLIIILVFTPLLTLQGLEGKLFIPVALAIVFALTGSLILSLTVIPVLSSFLLKNIGHEEAWLVRKLLAIYTPALKWSLQHSRVIVVAALAGMAIAGGLYTQIGKTFMPTMDEGSIIIGLEMLPSISLESATETNLRVHQAILRDVPEVKEIVARAGSDELGLDPMGLNQTDTFLVLKPIKEWRTPNKEWLIDQLRHVVANFPGLNYSFTQPIEMRVSEMIIGVRGDVAVKIYGSNLNQLNQLGEKMESLLKTVPGAEDVLMIKNEGVQYYQVEIDRLAAGRLGLSVDEIQQILRLQIEGQPLGIVLEEGKRTPILLRGTPDRRQSVALFNQIKLTLENGISIPLSEVATLKRTDGPVKIDRENATRMVVVQTNVRGRDLVSFVEEAKAKVAKEIPLEKGYFMKWGGQFENQQRAATRLSVVIPIALGMIFILLFATFNSLKQAVLVFMNIPFAMIGGVFAMALTGEYLSVPASVGFIALLGIAVLNGVVMVSYFNQLKSEGMPISEVIIEGARRRLRPVMMTASITAFGLIPLFFATGPGSEIQRPLAIVVIGGLITSTLLTLIMLPILYQRFGNE